jgi:hypothetical protein
MLLVIRYLLLIISVYTKVTMGKIRYILIQTHTAYNIINIATSLPFLWILICSTSKTIFLMNLHLNYSYHKLYQDSFQ